MWRNPKHCEAVPIVQSRCMCGWCFWQNLITFMGTSWPGQLSHVHTTVIILSSSKDKRLVPWGVVCVFLFQNHCSIPHALGLSDHPWDIHKCYLHISHALYFKIKLDYFISRDQKWGKRQVFFFFRLLELHLLSLTWYTFNCPRNIP